ncbi:MAG: AbrB/MazE/SpoVT family DNA-binding domain-containing protein [Gammaproteobacteria bacterium]|nr:AbrB/MazE/SpoVT family DNA-binding domain-containing protein [Gammaproteobacteria bacterium]
MHKLTRKRQVTVPKAVCNALGLEPGNMVEIFARDGVAHLVRMSDESLAGRFSDFVGDAGMPTGDDMQAAIKTRVKRKFAQLPSPRKHDDRS